MSKKFFWMSVLSAFIVANSAIASGPGPEHWKDDQGHLAPANVRRAADALWNAVEAEGAAAFDAGWGVGKQMPCGPQRICLNICTCGILECMMACCGEYETFGWSTLRQGNSIAYEAQQIIFDQRTREAETALANFKEEVNKHVAKPEHYSGDANICELGPWVEDGVWQINSNLFVSGRSDLSTVTQSTRDFVNTHGGWTNDYGT